MPKKSKRPHGHYCKVCGQYRANEKFSGKGHAAHICKSCAKLSPAEQAEAMTINRLLNLPMRRLSDSEKNWLKNRVHDKRPEVAQLAREVYNLHFPHAERNARKKQLLINTLSFEVHTTIFTEFGDELSVHQLFTAHRLSRVLTMTDLESGGEEQSVTLDKKKMDKLLRWMVHSLEIFMWAEDYGLETDGSGPELDILADDWEEDVEADLTDDLEPEPEGDVCWQVQIEYADHMDQTIVSYQDFLPDRPEELYLALLDFFEPDEDDFDADDEICFL